MIYSVLLILLGFLALWDHYRNRTVEDSENSLARLDTRGTFIGAIICILIGVCSLISELLEAYKL